MLLKSPLCNCPFLLLWWGKNVTIRQKGYSRICRDNSTRETCYSCSIKLCKSAPTFRGPPAQKEHSWWWGVTSFIEHHMLKSCVKNIVRNHKFVVYQISLKSRWDQTSSLLLVGQTPKKKKMRRLLLAERKKRQKYLVWWCLGQIFGQKARHTHTWSSSP